ncbi:MULTISPECIES: hypothetical protein [unclassified Polaribacter]|uniref:hypothetical protein n=1 Tax=unclassified Polaribacter TaxID=196858 RepID=UPI0011BDAA6A|nr:MULTISPECIES: hypothetical protein [unclassified Polaribacter]TXD48488.1 hypothetical protein ES043_17790 [Polaribacter sp. IC063]TXD55919.1 hypothetical protein ES044_17575 [Polaribacter sp. IC066]
MIFTSEKSVSYDLGAPEIQAVCKVTLNDGKTIEGFITFGTGGYEYKYRPNGFCFKHDNGIKQLILYDFKFNLSNLDSYASYRNGTSKLYYVENISKSYQQKPKTEFDEENSTLTITKTDIEKYRLLEQMTIYKKLPLDLSVGYGSDEQNGKTTIGVNQIKSIELLKKPSKRSLEIIKTARNKQSEKEEEWIDYQAPVWYHEIITDQEKIDYLSKFF